MSPGRAPAEGSSSADRHLAQPASSDRARGWGDVGHARIGPTGRERSRALAATVGSDISADTADLRVLLADGAEPVPRWAIPHTRAGAGALIARPAEPISRHGIDRLPIGMEATSPYWWPLARALQDAPARPRVCVLNPKLAHEFRKNDGALPKTDRAEAFVIAGRVRFGRHLPPPFDVDLRHAPPQRLTRFRGHRAKALAREKGYFLAFLFPKFSRFCQDPPFHGPFGATGCAVLEGFTAEELAQTWLEDPARYPQAKGHGRFEDPEELAATLQRAARDSFRLGKALADPLNVVLGTTMATIRTLTEAAPGARSPDRPGAQGGPPGPGFGPGPGPGLDGRPDRRDRALPRRGGVGPVGRPGLAGPRVRRVPGRGYRPDRGREHLPAPLPGGGGQQRAGHCPEYRAYDQAKVAQSTRHAHQRALVLTARELVRRVDALLRAGTLDRSPEERQDRKEATAPSQHRPDRAPAHRRAGAGLAAPAVAAIGPPP